MRHCASFVIRSCILAEPFLREFEPLPRAVLETPNQGTEPVSVMASSFCEACVG